jgi:hypothetical protein
VFFFNTMHQGNTHHCNEDWWESPELTPPRMRTDPVLEM